MQAPSIADTYAPRRGRLPDRRESDVVTLECDGQTFTAAVSLIDGKPQEVFLDGGHTGSMLSHILADAAIILSVAIQYGVPVDALAHSIRRIPAAVGPAEIDHPADSSPASVIGAALDLLQALTVREPQPTPPRNPSTPPKVMPPLVSSKA